MATGEAIELARALLARMIAHRRTGTNAFGVSADEVAAVLSAQQVTSNPAADERVAAAEVQLRVAIEGPATSPLARLVDTFGLDSIDAAVVAVLLAPEIHHELERAISYALDDFTRKRPDVGFVARLVGGADRGRHDRVLAHLDEGAALHRYGIVTTAQPSREMPARMRTVRLSDRIVAFLRGQDSIDELVRGFVQVGSPRLRRAELVMDPDVLARISRALDMPAPRVVIAGPEGAGRALAVEVLLAERGRSAIRCDLAGLVAEGQISERIVAALREAALRDSTAIFDGGTGITNEVPPALVHAIAKGASDFAVPLVFTLVGRATWLAQAIHDLVEITVPLPGFRERHELWRRALPPGLAAAEDLEAVAARYAFSGGVIARTARRAARAAELRDPQVPHVTLDDLGEAARLTFANRLGGMAQRIATGFHWDDLVLPKDTMEAVREVVRFARHRPFLLEEWGFAAKLPYGRGVSAILAGPPGTGKTMVAQLLAKELGYDLYRIDLSQVVNKYVGETEKNLAKIFDEAEASHAVLFFDEADALFSKRTDVRSSNDRYANLEVNYLLQRMETYDGVTLLATNLEQGLDEAFKRRVRFSIAFELPEEEERRRLWRSMFPAQVPLAPDIDWDLVAKRFEMAGGYIKKAALRAALIAVDAKRAVTTADLLEAARQEYREMGRIV